MTQKHPITPPPELVREWIAEWSLGDSWAQVCQNVALAAARWGADQELEACVEWFKNRGYHSIVYQDLLTARRPKPPSLKEQALTLLDDCSDRIDAAHENTIRRALEQLDD